MHPHLLGALARQRDRELLRPAEFRHPPRTLRPRPARRGALLRARRAVGEVLLDMGVHLMAAT